MEDAVAGINYSKNPPGFAGFCRIWLRAFPCAGTRTTEEMNLLLSPQSKTVVKPLRLNLALPLKTRPLWKCAARYSVMLGLVLLAVKNF